MKKDIFDIDKFNVIQDEENYYLFRALNLDDQREISEGINSENGEIQRVITNRQRYPENDRYANDTEISLKEVWDHTKSVNFYKGTNCISLSSNANVSIDYGSKYGHKYLMIKVPKGQSNKIYNAGQYMLSELNEILEDRIKEIPQDSEIIKLIHEIESKESYSDVKTVIGERFKSASSSGRYMVTDNIRVRESMFERFNKRQAFSEEQQLEYNKIIGKLTLLEIYGMLPKKIFNTINTSSLTMTIGSEFSNREFVHYGEISSDEFVQISKVNLDMFALLQIAKEQGVDSQAINEIERRLIEYTNQGYDLIEKDGKLYYSNGKEEIDLDIGNDSVLINENNLKNNIEFSIEEIFDKTNGSISYARAKNATQFVYNLSIAQRKSIELANVLKSILNDSKLKTTIDEIAQKSIAINDKIITRKNGRGMQVSESVNIDMNRGERKQFSDKEQRKIYEKVKSLSIEELETIISNSGSELEQEIYSENLRHSDVDTSQTREERLNRYYAEAIIDTLDISKIYKNATRNKNLSEQERENILIQIEKADCKRLVNAFTKAGISESEVAGYIINIFASNGYQGYTFEELSRLDDLDDIISKNIKNTNLKGHVYPSVMEEVRGIIDNDNRVGDTLINLRDYQKETVDNVDRIFESGKRFAGVVLPTGAGKSFVAMTEMLKNQNGNILYIAPQQEILSQVQRHILKNIAEVEVLTTDEIDKLKEEQNTTNTRELKLPEGKILPSQANEYVKKVFPHLKMLCYQGLASQNDIELTDEQKVERDNEEKELRDILKNADANLIVFDELHRSGAKTWKNVVEQLINSNEKANILGITATPIRDVDHIDMMKELASMTHTYTENELVTKQYLGYEMYLTDAIQRGLVVEPKIVSFDFMLRDTDEYQEILEMIENEKNEAKKKQLIEIKTQIDDLINGDTDITEHVKNNISQKENEEIGKIIKSTIQKKDGRYIVFLPQHSRDDGLTETQYFEQQEQKIRQILAEIDVEPEIWRLSSADSKAENHRSITDFENSNSKHLKIMLAINKLNEGVHVDGINGEIMYRKINDGSTILYLQQLGRVIYSLDPDKQISDEDIPIVYDIYNNYLVQNMNRTINQTTPKSDLQKLQEVIEWIDKHGYNPDINSENTKEARKAITLKKIQTKYKKYIDGINNPRLSKSDIYEIEQIMELAYSIDLFNKEIGDRIIPPGERDLSDVQLFKITATQTKFLELYKEANKVLGNKERHKNRPKAKLNDIMNILETLNSNDIFVDNNLIKYGDTLKDVIGKCPEEIKQILLEELSNFDEGYPIGQEYNFAKTAFRDRSLWSYFKDADVRKLYSCGIFEDIDEDYLKNYSNDKAKIEKLKGKILFDDFIIYSHNSLKGLNIKTGTYLDENGKSFSITSEKERETKRFEECLAVVRQVHKHLPEGYTLANESFDEIADLSARDCVRLYRPDDHNEHGNYYSGIPIKFPLKEEMYYARRHLQRKDIELSEQEIIEYKKLGLLPLKINEEGIDEDTHLPRSFFGKSVKPIEIQKTANSELGQLLHLKEVLTLSTNLYGVCTVNESIDELPEGNFMEYVSEYRKEGSDSRRTGIPRRFNLRKEIEQARIYLQKNKEELTQEEIIEYKKLGILPLNLNENGIDIDTNLPRTDFEFISVDINGFDRKGYYCKKQENGTYVNTGLKYNLAGFRKDRKHVITKTIEDIRGFDIYGKCWLNNNRQYDKAGFKQDGTHKDTGELYYEGYNAFGLDENGKNRQGRTPKEIIFTRDYILNGVTKGKAKEILNKYGVKNRSSLNLTLYTATEMCPQIKNLLCEQISKYQMMIKQREKRLKQLESQKTEDKVQIEKLKKENEILRNRIGLMSPMQDFDK